MVYAGSVYIPCEDHWVISKYFFKHMYIYVIQFAVSFLQIVILFYF